MGSKLKLIHVEWSCPLPDRSRHHFVVDIFILRTLYLEPNTSIKSNLKLKDHHMKVPVMPLNKNISHVAEVLWHLVNFRDLDIIFVSCIFQFYPKWIAPNVLTFSGFLLLVLQFGILAHYDFNFYASALNYPSYPPIPNYVWLVSAFCLFAAHTLGKTPIDNLVR